MSRSKWISGPIGRRRGLALTEFTGPGGAPHLQVDLLSSADGFAQLNVDEVEELAEHLNEWLDEQEAASRDANDYLENDQDLEDDEADR
jgi:hypothetical protein